MHLRSVSGFTFLVVLISLKPESKRYNFWIDFDFKFITMQLSVMRRLRLLCGLVQHAALSFIWMRLNMLTFTHYFPKHASLDFLLFSYVAFSFSLFSCRASRSSREASICSSNTLWFPFETTISFLSLFYNHQRSLNTPSPSTALSAFSSSTSPVSSTT